MCRLTHHVPTTKLNNFKSFQKKHFFQVERCIFTLSCIDNQIVTIKIMVFSDKKILQSIETKDIVIEPFRIDCLGTNSYDVHLGKWLATYKSKVLDAKKHNSIVEFEIPTEGYVLKPGMLYLGVTEEYTETHNAVPFLEGKSSTGRLGIDIHATAGKGDVGFCNHWTLEISVALPVRIYAGMPIGQLIYFQVEGEIENLYNKKTNAKYNQRTDRPVESMMWKNTF